MVPRKWNDGEMDVSHRLTMPNAAGKKSVSISKSVFDKFQFIYTHFVLFGLVSSFWGKSLGANVTYSKMLIRKCYGLNNSYSSSTIL